MVEFGAIWAPRIDPKWKKNGVKKQSDFQTKLAARTPDIGPRTLLRQPPLAAPICARSLPKTIGSGRRGKKKGRRKKGRKEEGKKREKGQEGREKYPGSDTPGARGLANYIFI